MKSGINVITDPRDVTSLSYDEIQDTLIDWQANSMIGTPTMFDLHYSKTSLYLWWLMIEMKNCYQNKS